MDEDKIVEAMARALVIRDHEKARIDSPRPAPPSDWNIISYGTQELYRQESRAAWNAAKAVLAEATREPLRALEAAARVAQEETLTAPNAPGWPAVCAVLHHIGELRTILAAALDQR